jgi:hypothetical protein
VFGAPIGRLDQVQEGEDGREFNRKMRGKALHDVPRPWVLDEGVELTLEMATRDGETVRRDVAGPVAVAHPQGPLQNPVHTRGEVPVGLATRSARGALRRAAGKRRRLPMQLALGAVQIVFQPVDPLAQLIAIPAVPIAIPIGALVLAPQPLDFLALPFKLALLALEFLDQLFTRCRSPTRLHAPVMAR